MVRAEVRQCVASLERSKRSNPDREPMTFLVISLTQPSSYNDFSSEKFSYRKYPRSNRLTKT
jgi:hypothetical protein